MPNITCEIWINAPVLTVYNIAKEVETFSEYMKDVESVKIVEANDSKVVTSWVGIVSSFGLKVRWTEEDIWDDKNHTCIFKQLSGDYDSMSGKWSFIEENNGTRFYCEVDYEYNVPGLGLLVKKVIHNLVKQNLEGILEAFKKRSEESLGTKA